MLSESERDDVRDHLADCQSCQGYAMKVNSFAGDLKRLGMVEIPFDLAKSVLSDLVSQESLGENQKEHDLKVIIPTILITILVTVSAVKLFNLVPPHPPEASLPSSSDSLKHVELETLKQLQEIESHLKSVTRSESLIKDKEVVSIRLDPIHWHLEFDQDSIRREFIQKVKKFPVGVLYEASDMIIFSISREELIKLQQQMHLIAGLSLSKDMKDVGQLPESTEPVRVSLILNLKNNSNENNSFHTHFEFLLRNGFSFNHHLKEELHFTFLYDSPELWVVQVSEKESPVFFKEVRLFPGLIPHPSLNAFPKDQKTIFTIYVQE